MKKVWSALLALFIIFSFGQLCGCSKKTPPPVNTNFQADANVEFKDVSITCHVKQSGFKNSEIYMTKPKELNGLRIIKKEDECSLKFKNMKFDMDMSKFPKTSFAQIMLSCINEMVDVGNLNISQQDNCYIYQGNINEGKFKLYQDGETGNIIKIEVPQAELKVEFTNIKK